MPWNLYRRHAPYWLFLTLLVSLGACTTGRSSSPGSALQPAVAAYLAGDYTDAIDRCKRILGEGPSGDLERDAYLYLGRSYRDAGQLNLAIATFSAAVSLGYEEPFTSYLLDLQVDLAAKPESVAQLERVTRGQLAIYLAARHGVSPGDGREAIAWAVQVGIMSAMPTGFERPDAPVTTASFWSSMVRMAKTSAREWPRAEVEFNRALRSPESFIAGRKMAQVVDEWEGLR